jgi:hypothetical protein
MVNQLKAVGIFRPQNMLNRFFSLPLGEPHYTHDGWSVIDYEAFLFGSSYPNTIPPDTLPLANMGDSTAELVSMIQIGDVIVTAGFSGWPKAEDGAGHGDLIVDMRKLTNGKATLDSEVFLMYNGTDPQNKGWRKIRDLLPRMVFSAAHDNNGGQFYVIRSLDFAGFGELFNPGGI